MRSLAHARLTLALVALAAAASIVLAVTAAAETQRTQAVAGGHPLLGITGNTGRFKEQTGQDSSVIQAFLGWGHGQTYGAPFAQLFPSLGPIPMIHLGTGSGIAGGQARREIITPLDIAQGKGDSYLIALNHAIANWGKAIYVRPMAEMNLHSTFYSGYNANGTLKDAAHDPARYREAFRRISVILHGGTVETVNNRLTKLGLPPVKADELLPNLFPRLRIIWSPLAGASPRVPGNDAINYYPGDPFVDVIGGDIYDEALTDTAPWQGLEALAAVARAHGKPFAIPEAGLNKVDDPAFVLHMCSFLKRHPATEVYVHYESKPGSEYDFAGKPKSLLAYRECIVPLAGPLPEWAAANAPGGGAAVTTLTLTPRPAAGPAPHDVTFAINAKLTVPIQQWLLVFDDGTETGGPGAPPATVRHTYASAGVYPATLIVWPFPPFTSAAARFYTSADVTVGTDPPAVLSIVPTPDTGPAPLSVSLRIEETLSGPITSWQLIFDDGKTREGTGAPPHFAGHTFTEDGTYDVLLVVNQSNGRRYMALATVVAGSGGTGGGGTGTGGTGGTGTGGTTPPATATETGTVLVGGQPFDGGPIPYNVVVDVTNGTVTLTVRGIGKVKVYTQNKIPAKFKLIRGKDKKKPIVELRLTGGNFSTCPKGKPKRKPSSVSATRKSVVRQIWSDGKGKFRTKGRYSSATVRGTRWLTADRCDGTFIRVRTGVLEVRDVPDNRTVRLPAPRTYLAEP